jgi:hypothetical protein
LPPGDSFNRNTQGPFGADCLHSPPPLRATATFIGDSRRHSECVRQAHDGFSEGAVVLRGAAGSGKTRLAHFLHESLSVGSLAEVDAIRAEASGLGNWLADLRAIVADTPGTVLVRHVEALTPSMAEAVGRVLAIAKTTDGGAS